MMIAAKVVVLQMRVPFLGPQYSTAPLKKGPQKGPYFRELSTLNPKPEMATGVDMDCKGVRPSKFTRRELKKRCDKIHLVPKDRDVQEAHDEERASEQGKASKGQEAQPHSDTSSFCRLFLFPPTTVGGRNRKP